MKHLWRFADVNFGICCLVLKGLKRYLCSLITVFPVWKPVISLRVNILQILEVAKLVVHVWIPPEADFFAAVNKVLLHIACGNHPFIGLIWLKYYLKGHKTRVSNSSIWGSWLTYLAEKGGFLQILVCIFVHGVWFWVAYVIFDKKLCELQTLFIDRIILYQAVHLMYFRMKEFSV